MVGRQSAETIDFDRTELGVGIRTYSPNIFREVIDKTKYPHNYNREGGYRLSKDWLHLLPPDPPPINLHPIVTEEEEERKKIKEHNLPSLPVLNMRLLKDVPPLFSGPLGRQNFLHRLFSLTTWSLEHFSSPSLTEEIDLEITLWTCFRVVLGSNLDPRLS
jgi:hypothetical protein